MHTLTTQLMCVTCFTLWFCTSTLCSVLTIHHLLMGFSEHLSAVSDTGCHPSPDKTSNEASGGVGILFFFLFSRVCVYIYMHILHMCGHICTGTHEYAHMRKPMSDVGSHPPSLFLVIHQGRSLSQIQSWTTWLGSPASLLQDF